MNKMQHFKYLLLLLFIVALNSNISAQSFGGGIRAGISGCQIEGDGLSGYDKLGYSLGFFVNNSLSASRGFQFELLYTRKGTRSPDKLVNIGLHYAEIPILYTYNLSKIAKKKVVKNFFFNIGIAPAILIGITNKGFYFDYTFPEIDLAGTLGVGYKLINNFSLLIRNTHSIIGVIPLKTRMLNNCLTFSLSYHLK